MNETYQCVAFAHKLLMAGGWKVTNLSRFPWKEKKWETHFEFTFCQLGDAKSKSIDKMKKEGNNWYFRDE